jgi:peptidyl-prolyl cis-trans isomerase C
VHVSAHRHEITLHFAAILGGCRIHFQPGAEFMFLTTSLRNKAAGLSCLLALASSALVFASPAMAKVLATVNGKEITDEDVKIAGDDLRGTLPPQLEGKARESYILDFLIDGELVAQKALADKADQAPDFAKKLAYYREKLLMESVLEQVAKTATTDAAIKATYDEAAKAQKPQTEIRARHILVGSEDEAKAALKRIMGGEEFAKVAKEVSKDPGSEGGDLGWFTKDRMVPEFADAAFKLEAGQISDPVKSPFGWHIIEVEEKREKTFPPLADVKDQVSRYVAQKAQAEFVSQLRKTAKVERTEPPVAPAAPGVPAPGAAPAAPAPGKK